MNINQFTHPDILNYSSGTSPQYSVNMSASTHTQAQYTGSFSPQAEPVDFSGLTRPIGIEYVSSLGSSSYSRESTPSNGSSVHFMEGYRDYNGKQNCYNLFFLFFCFYLRFNEAMKSPHFGLGEVAHRYCIARCSVIAQLKS